MSVYLEHFPKTWEGAVKKAKPVRDLIQDNIDVLREAKPKTVRRYRDFHHAVHNLHRLGTEDPNYHGYMIRKRDERGALIGLASVATNQAVWHTGLEKLFEGSDVSYWLVEGRRFTEHVSVAQALIGLSGEFALETAERRPSLMLRQTEDLESGTADSVVVNRVFAAVPITHTALSPGFGYWNTLPAVGDPSKLQLPSDRPGPDPLEIAQGGQVSQLHYGEFQIPIPR